MNDEYRIKLEGIDKMDAKILGLLIDSLVDYYTEKFGLENLSDVEPAKPSYDYEDTTLAKEYLQKFRLNK
jgi:hypothetical protein